MSEPLRIRFASDVESAKQGMASLAASVSANALQIGTSLKAVNDNAERVGRVFQAMPLIRGGLVALTASIVAVTAGVALTGAALDQANAQLERFIALGESAARADVGAAFFQRFSEAATDAKLKTDAIEAALRKASSAVNPGFEQTDPIRDRLADLFESGYLGDRQSKGLADYRRAASTEDRIRAAVTAMQELEQAGERLAAIDVGQKLFGDDVAERLRNGQLTVDAIAESLDRQRDDIVSQEEIDRAIEFKERLDAAYATIDEMLRVSVSLANAGQGINSIWLRIVETTASAAANARTFLDRMTSAAGMSGRLQSPLAGQASDNAGNLAGQLGADVGTAARGRTIYDGPAGPGMPPTMVERDVPLPPRRPLDMRLDPEKYGIGVKPSGGSKSSSESLDAVETYIHGLEKATAATKAEMQAIGANNVERQIAINLAKAEETAKQSNIALTEQQIARIRETTRASVEARDAIDDARESTADLREISSGALKGIAEGFRRGASGAEVLANVLDKVASKLEDMAISGALDALVGKAGSTGGGVLGAGGFGGLLSGLTSLFAGGFAEGGTVPAGKWALVGEKGPELIGASNASRMVVPNAAMMQGGGQSNVNSSITHAPQFNITAAPGMSEEKVGSIVAAASREQMRHLERNIGSMMSQHQRRYGGQR